MAHAANPVVNGDFELPALSSTATGGDTPSGWSVDANADIGLYTGKIYLSCCQIQGTPAELLNQFASFGPGDRDTIGALTQTLSLNAGRYVLSFDEGALGGGSQSLTASVLGALNNPSTANVAQANDHLDATFVGHTLNFTSTGAPITLAFQSTGAGGGVDVILDNVSIAAVPEPATWGLMLLGIFGMGATLRARRGLQPATA